MNHLEEGLLLPIFTLTRRGLLREAINLYTSLRARNIAPDNLLLLFVAKARAVLGNLRKATELHDEAILFGFHWDIAQEGLLAFREMGLIGVRPNVVTVSTILHACSELRDLNSGSIQSDDDDDDDDDVHDEIE